MAFKEEDVRADIDMVIETIERHCIGEVNLTYERYVFNRLIQDVGDTFDPIVRLWCARRVDPTRQYCFWESG